MDAALRELLDQHDDAEGCEVPRGNSRAFPHGALARSVSKIRSALRSELGLSFDLDGNVQDASFHDELRVLHPQSLRAGGVVVIGAEIAIRFSHFGRLFTIYSGLPELPA